MVLELLPLRWLVTPSGLASPTPYPKWWLISACITRSMKAFPKMIKISVAIVQHS